MTLQLRRAAVAAALLLLIPHAGAVPTTGALSPAPQAAPTVALEPLKNGSSALTFAKPVFVTHPGDGTDRLFVVEQGGTIRVLVGGVPQSATFLDITTKVLSGGERGLLGLAFHPKFGAAGDPNRGRFYVAYTAVAGAYTRDGGAPADATTGMYTIASYRVGSNANRADPTTEKVFFAQSHPASNHNGGMLAFGPDGYLYVGMGDGGGAGDTANNAQNPNVLLGKMLRLDVDGASGYAIPSTNPFAGGTSPRPEIWALGLRNPWRYSFDRGEAGGGGKGDLYIGDVGQGAFEEIDVQAAASRGGENYGWRIMEGPGCYNASSCSQQGLTLPVNEYGRGLGCSVTGGYVYRGTKIAGLAGAYIFGDYCSGRIWSLERDGGGAWVRTQLLDTDLGISSFGEDRDGELYVAALSNNTVYRLTGPTTTPPPPPPPPTGRPDLQVTGFSAKATRVGQPATVRVTVANKGQAEAGGSVHVHVYVDVEPPTTADVDLHLYPPTLAPGKSATLEGDIPAAALREGRLTLWAWVDGHEQLAESNEANNTRKTTVRVR